MIGQSNWIRILLLFVVIASVATLSAEKYAGEIFRMGAGVRNYAMGGTGLTDANSSALAYWNASLLSKKQNTRFELMHAEELGEFQYDTISGVIGSKKPFAIVISRIGIDDIPLTRKDNPDDSLSANNQPYEYDSVNNADYIIYAGFATDVSGIPIGVTPKFAYRVLAKETGYGFGADLTSYHDFGENVTLGARLRDFFSTQIFWENGTHETVNPGLDLESNFHFNFPWIHTPVSIIFGIESYFENRDESATTSLGFMSLDYHAGLAIQAHEVLSLFLGYDVENVTAGLTLSLLPLELHYAFEQNTELEDSHRVSLGLQF